MYYLCFYILYLTVYVVPFQVAVRGSLRGVLGGDGPGAPPLLDPSEFPSLTARGQEQPHHHIPPPGSKPYGRCFVIKSI